MRRLSLAVLFGFIAISAYIFIASIRFLPLSYKAGFISSPVDSIKRISFPELKGTCFNPSIIKLENGYLLTFRWDEPDRCLKNLAKSARWSAKTIHVCVVELANDFTPINTPEVLSFTDQFGKEILDPADMRIIQVEGKIIGIFNTTTASQNNETIVRLFSAELRKDPVSSKYQAFDCKKLDYENSKYAIEKNWTPFVFENELYLVYEISPHTIIKPDLKTGLCRLIDESATSDEWKYGALRGGTPAIKSDNSYLSFFHSVLPAARMSHHQSYYYLMGCYTFSSTAPFKIQSMTTLPIIHKDLYSLRFNHRKILYPSGIVENHKHYIVACGENDEHIVFVTVDKEKLLKELKEIGT